MAGLCGSRTNTFAQIKVLNVKTGAIQAITSDHYNSVQPHLEFGRQVALLPFRPHVEDYGADRRGGRASRTPTLIAP